jgi:hypothetical protein
MPDKTCLIVCSHCIQKLSLWTVTYSWNYRGVINAMQCNVIFQNVNPLLILSYCPMVEE